MRALVVLLTVFLAVSAPAPVSAGKFGERLEQGWNKFKEGVKDFFEDIFGGGKENQKDHGKKPDPPPAPPPPAPPPPPPPPPPQEN